MISAGAELARLEIEAKATAARQVAAMLKRPDQLEKVDQYRRRAARKKSAVEAMLKTAVQSQLDGVRTGLNQLQNCIKDVQDIKQSLGEVDETYQSIAHLHDKLEKVRGESSKHRQLAAAVENLKHIFNVPETVKRTKDYIEDGKLLHAHKCLTDLEQSRDDLLFELHKQQQKSPTDENTVRLYFEDVEKLSDLLGKQLWLILQRTISTVRREPTVIVTVLRIIEREERINEACLKRYKQSGFLPPGRPKEWKKSALKKLEEAVEVRVEACQLEERDADKMWLVRHLELIRQITIDDLKVIKTLCEPCFPPTYNIIERYVKMYHSSITTHMNDIIQQGLEGNEVVSLLIWTGDYKSKDMMGNPDLKIDTTELTPLLDSKAINELQNKYLENLRSNFKEWMSNSLKVDVKEWTRERQPDADDKAFFNTSLPVILFQMIEQNLQVAATINEMLVRKALNISMDELMLFTKTYRDTVTEFRGKHMVDRNFPQFYLHYLIANVNNCMSFGDFANQLKRKFIQGGVESGRSDRFQQVEKAFQDLAAEWCDHCLDEVMMDLTPHLNLLCTKKWFDGCPAVDTICITLEDYCQDFVHLKDKFFQTLMMKAYDKISFEYLKALFGKKISLKGYEQRKLVAERICRDAVQIGQMFDRLASGILSTTVFEALPVLAEVIKLRDTSMISLELSGLVNKYPDLKSEHLVNLLILRGDFGRNEARQAVLDTLDEEDHLKTKPQGIFTNIPYAT